jgi:hypothetical protein
LRNSIAAAVAVLASLGALAPASAKSKIECKQEYAVKKAAGQADGLSEASYLKACLARAPRSRHRHLRRAPTQSLKRALSPSDAAHDTPCRRVPRFRRALLEINFRGELMNLLFERECVFRLCTGEGLRGVHALSASATFSSAPSRALISKSSANSYGTLRNESMMRAISITPNTPRRELGAS